MKLVEKYTPKKLVENEVYAKIKCVFHKVFCDTPDVNLGDSSFSDGKFIYKETEVEREFYEKQYLNLVSKENYSKNIDGYEYHCLNRYEQALMDYAVGIDKKMFILRGRLGWGKTTLLRKVFYHLLPKNDKNKILPIYVSFNNYLNRFNIADNSSFEDLFYQLLSDHIRKYTGAFLGGIESDIWSFLRSKTEYTCYDITCSRLSDMVKRGILTAIQEITMVCELQEKELNRTVTSIYSLQFLQERYGIIPILIFDDLDPLQYSFLDWLFRETYSLSHQYGFKTILAIRPNTYFNIKSGSNFDALVPIEYSLDTPDCSTYLCESLSAFVKEVEMMDKDSGVVVNDMIINPYNLNKFISNYCRIVMSHDAISFLENISGGDLRLFKCLLRTYLSSGYIRLEKILSDVINLDCKDDSLPIWIVYTSIITRNYLSVFPHTKTNEDEFVINMFCNGRECMNTYLIRLHVLAYLYRCRQSSIGGFIQLYRPLLSDGDVSLEDSVKRVLKRFNNAGLIMNNKCLYIERRADIDDVDFHMLPLGFYYMDDLFSKFEYVVYMKDDVDYDEDVEIADCVSVKENKKRFVEVVKYLSFFYKKEKAFLQRLEGTQLDIYSRYFSPIVNCNLYSLHLANKMREYGERRGFDVYDLDKLRQEMHDWLNGIFVNNR